MCSNYSRICYYQIRNTINCNGRFYRNLLFTRHQHSQNCLPIFYHYKIKNREKKLPLIKNSNKNLIYMIFRIYFVHINMRVDKMLRNDDDCCYFDFFCISFFLDFLVKFVLYFQVFRIKIDIKLLLVCVKSDNLLCFKYINQCAGLLI